VIKPAAGCFRDGNVHADGDSIVFSVPTGNYFDILWCIGLTR